MSLETEGDVILQKYSNDGKEKVLTLGNGVVVLINEPPANGQVMKEDVLEEIAAAIAAVKMYISSKSNANGSNGCNKGTNSNGNGKQNRIHLWYRSWLNEITKGYDINPYRRSLSFEQSLS